MARAAVRRTIGRLGFVLARRLPTPVVRSIANRLPPLLKARLRNIIFSVPGSPPGMEGPLKDLVQSALLSVKGFDSELGWLVPSQIQTAPVIRPRLTLNLHRLLFNLVKSFRSRPPFVILLNALTHGGAELYAVSLYRALASIYGPSAVAMIVTDQRKDTARDWLPAEATVLFLDDLQPALDLDAKGYLLRHLFALMRPRAVFNVNSRSLWDSLPAYGGAIRAFTALYSTMFCYDYRADGAKGGYGAFSFRDNLAHHNGVLLDNEAFRRQLIDDYGVPPSEQAKMRTLYTPLQDLRDHDAPVLASGPNRKTILWAGRFAFQKIPLLALEIARLCPEYTFHFHGEGDPMLTEQMKAAAPSNVVFFGRFASMEVLLRQGYGLLLYTSITDGVPTVIQGAARFGLPVVAGAVGGIPELVRPDTGWPVAPADEASAYAAAIRHAMHDDGEREQRAARMLELVTQQHDPARFAIALKTLVEETSRDPL